MTDWIIKLLMLASSIFILLAAIGVLRLPDLLTRMHASTKAGALGITLMMVAASFHFFEAVVTAKSLAVIIFILITAPVAAHAIGRAAYFVGVPVWSKTVKDELINCYDPESHRLLSGLETEEELELYRQNLDFKPRIRVSKRDKND